MAGKFNLEELLTRNHPRKHHYTFAHHALCSMTLQLRDQLRQMLIGSHAATFLQGLWKHVAQNLDDDEILPADGLFVHNEFLNAGGILSIVVLPQPQCATEAHMVGIAFLPTPPVLGEKKESEVRYFTLEKGFDDNDAPHTALCEWQRDDDGISHLNYGDGPTPAVAAFAREIMAHLSVSWTWQDEPWKLS